MSTIKAYRIQHKDGWGLFRDTRKGRVRKHCVAIILPELSRRFNDFPTPGDEGLIVYNKLCGFRRWEDVMGWTTEYERKVLKEYGYRFYELHLRRAGIGIYNVVFYPKDICQRHQII